MKKIIKNKKSELYQLLIYSGLYPYSADKQGSVGWDKVKVNTIVTINEQQKSAILKILGFNK